MASFNTKLVLNSSNLNPKQDDSPVRQRTSAARRTLRRWVRNVRKEDRRKKVREKVS
jgi:hypothetical protein